MNIKNIDTANFFQQSYHIKENEVIVGSLTLSQIEQLIGSTPYYVYDRKIITNKVSELHASLPNKVKLHYAIKANPYPSLVHFLKNKVEGFDVASKREMLLAMQTGMPVKKISFAGPGKTDADIRAAIIAGVTLHIESENELNRTSLIATELMMKANIALRVNPQFELKSSGMKMSGGAKPFGIDEEQIAKLLTRLSTKSINLRGFHIFSGSQNLNADAIIECHQQTFSLVEQLLQHTTKRCHHNIDYINIGGGLGIPYFKSEKALDLTRISKNLSSLLVKYKNCLTKIDIILELGRYLVGEAGLYVSKIIDKKHSRGTNYLVCNGGLHHHLANSGNFGQVIRKNYPVAIGNKMFSTDLEQVTVVGPLCTPLDILAEKITLPSADIGDYFVVFQSGAYGASASPQEFLSQAPLAEILL